MKISVLLKGIGGGEVEGVSMRDLTREPNATIGEKKVKAGSQALITDLCFSNPFVMKCLQQNIGKCRKMRP